MYAGPDRRWWQANRRRMWSVLRTRALNALRADVAPSPPPARGLSLTGDPDRVQGGLSGSLDSHRQISVIISIDEPGSALACSRAPAHSRAHYAAWVAFSVQSEEQRGVDDG